MTSKELRVGNWVSYNATNYLIDNSANTNVVGLLCKDKFEFVHAEELQPIKIVGKMLETNGWKHHIDYGRQYYTKDNIDLCSINVDDGFQFVCNNQTIKHVSYVHELQNLLWALGLDDDIKL